MSETKTDNLRDAVAGLQGLKREIDGILATHTEERRLAEEEIRAEERERCAVAIKAACGACEGKGYVEAIGTGYARNPDDPHGDPLPAPERERFECEYCGRPIAAIRNLEDGK